MMIFYDVWCFFVDDFWWFFIINSGDLSWLIVIYHDRSWQITIQLGEGGFTFSWIRGAWLWIRIRIRIRDAWIHTSLICTPYAKNKQLLYMYNYLVPIHFVKMEVLSSLCLRLYIIFFFCSVSRVLFLDRHFCPTAQFVVEGGYWIPSKLNIYI